MIKALVTLLMIVALIISIKKNYHTALTLFVISIVALLGLTFVNKTPLGETGSAVLDVFEMVYTTSSSSLSRTCLIIMSVLGYVQYMNYIKASQLFATVIAKPLTKLKRPYLLASLVICLGFVLKLVIPSGLSMLSLIIGILYPVLMAVGATRATAATAFMLSTVACWGPAESGIYVLLGMLEKEVPVTEFFTKYQIPMVLILMLTILIVFPITQKYFDKKENAQGSAELQETKSAKEYGIPMFYAIFPLFPLIFVLVFSDLVIKTISISVPTACFISLLIVIALRLICEKKPAKDIINETQEYFNGMGNFVSKIAFVIIGGTLFSSAISKIGGISYIIELANGAGASSFILTFVACIIACFTVAVCASINANIPLFGEVFLQIAETTGANPLALFNAFLLSGTPGTALAPITGTIFLTSSTCDVPITTIIKRELIPVAAIIIVTNIFTAILF